MNAQMNGKNQNDRFGKKGRIIKGYSASKDFIKSNKNGVG